MEAKSNSVPGSGGVACGEAGGLAERRRTGERQPGQRVRTLF